MLFFGADSDYSPCRSEAKFFRIEFSDLHVSKEDSIKPWCYQLESQLFEAEYLADEDPVFVPADVAAIVHPSQKETLGVREPRQLAWQSDEVRVVETSWDLIVQALMRALVVEHVAKAIEAALLREWMPQAASSCPPSAYDASAHGDRFVAVGLLECAHARSRASSRLATPPSPGGVRHIGTCHAWHEKQRPRRKHP
jgi:hypothetical protein